MNRIKHILFVLLFLSFLFYSCGIPSFCTLNNLSVSASAANHSISISGVDTDLSKITVGPGLLICYVPFKDGESLTKPETSNNKVYSAFSELVKSKLLIEDNFILTTKDENTDFSLYAFELGSTSVNGPSYTLDLNSAGFISNNSINTGLITIEKDESDETGKKFVLRYSGDKFVSLTADNVTDETVGYYIFAAFSAEVGLFSNNWWSNLSYLGSFEI